MEIQFDHICVLAAEADSGIAEVIGLELGDRGRSTRTHGANCPARRACIAVISARALQDPGWLAAVQEHEGGRIIAISYDRFDDIDVPAALRELNWLKWDVVEAEVFYERLFAAIYADPQWHDERRILENEAASWAGRNRPDHLLIEDRARAKAALRHVQAPIPHPSMAPSDRLRIFVQRSNKTSAKARRKRLRTISFRVVFAAVLVWLLVLIRNSLTVPEANRYLTQNLSSGLLSSQRPDRELLLAAALYVQAGDNKDAASLAFNRLTDGLSQFSSSGVIGGNATFATTAAVLDDNGAYLFGGDALGGVSKWDANTDQLLWRRPATGARIDAIAIDATATHVAVSRYGGGLSIADVSPWRVRPVPAITAAVREVRPVASGGWLVRTTGDALYLVAADGTVRHVPGTSGLIAIGTPDGRPRALIRPSPSTLALLDVASGRILARRAWPAYPFDAASFAPDSDGLAVVGTRGEVFYATTGLALTPLGTSVPDIATILTTLPHGQVAVGSAQRGVAVLDVSSRLDVGRICSLAGSVSVITATTQDRVVCLDDVLGEVWDTLLMRPRPAPAGVPADHPATKMKDGRPIVIDGNGTYAVIGETNGEYRFFGFDADKTKFLYVHPFTVPATDVDFNARSHTFAVGAADGEVLEVDYSASARNLLPVSKWQLPDHSPVTSIHWTNDNSQLIVHTAAGHWWYRPSCAGCGLEPSLLLTRVRERLWGCYDPNEIAGMVSQARRLFGIVECPKSTTAGGH